MGCGGSAPQQQQQQREAKVERSAAYTPSEAPVDAGASLTVRLTGPAGVAGTAEVQWANLARHSSRMLVGVFSASDPSLKVPLLSQTVDGAVSGAASLPLRDGPLAPGTAYEVRVLTAADDAQVCLARAPLPQLTAGDSTKVTDAEDESAQKAGGGTAEDANTARAEQSDVESPRNRGRGLSMSTTATAATAATLPASDDEDPDDVVYRSLVKLREQCLADAKRGGMSAVRINGKPLESRSALELGSKDLARVRIWADLLPPFDPIPVLEKSALAKIEAGEGGGVPPRESLLKANQELLEKGVPTGVTRSSTARSAPQDTMISPQGGTMGSPAQARSKLPEGSPTASEQTGPSPRAAK
eukprot:TRINITY_DN2333_c1_g1_i1.p1 TRINITY_DN2333_c1_g1~~TRINITY_DN2333_c1_g1_i1.p1  ORF type:complete len:387 (+),score=111.02 TRINITY_DN2333_c1_g1_i1:88-1161(+)